MRWKGLWDERLRRVSASILRQCAALRERRRLPISRSAPKGGKQRTVRVIAELVEWSTVRSVTVVLRYSDPASAVQVDEQLRFVAGGPTTQVWQFTPQDLSRAEYSWQATYLKHDGSLVAMDREYATDASLVLPRSAGTDEKQRRVRVVADLVEWTKVGSVTVALRYSDPASALRVEEQLKFVAGAPTTQVWQFTPRNVSMTEYSWQATYLKHDGSIVALDAQQTTDESLVLPPHAD